MSIIVNRKIRGRFKSIESALKQMALRLVFTNANKTAVMNLLLHRIERGSTESGAINGLREIYIKEYGRYNPLTIILSEVSKKFMADASLLGALEGFCDPEIRPILASGRSSGKSVEALRLAAEHYKNASLIRNTVLAALAGPLTSMVGMAIVIYVFSAKVFPSLAASIGGSGSLPPMLRIMVTFSDFVVGSSFAILMSIAALVAYASWSMPNQLRGREILDKFPPWSVYRGAQSASFLVTLASLLQASMTTKKALDVIAENSSAYVASWVKKITRSLVMGNTEGVALSNEFFVREARVELRSYVDSPDFIEKLPSIASDVRTASLKSVVAASKVATIAILVAIAVYVGMSFAALMSIDFKAGG